MRTLKIVLLACVCVAAFTSCATQRRCMAKFPPQPADTVTTELVAYRDTIVYAYLPADTVTDSVKVVLPCPDADGFVSDTAKVTSRYAGAKAWIADEKLRVRLEVYKSVFAFTLDSAIRASTKTVTVTKTVVVKVRHVPAFYKASLFVNILLVLLFVIGIWLSLRR